MRLVKLFRNIYSNPRIYRFNRMNQKGAEENFDIEIEVQKTVKALTVKVNILL